MKFIQDLREGDNAVEHYFCKKKETLKTKAGKSYMSLLLSDKTGSIPAKVWNLNNNIQSFDAGDYIKIDGVVSRFNDELQLSISKIRRSAAGEYLPADYVPVTDKPIDKMFEELVALINSIENAHLSALLTAIFIKNQEVQAAFCRHSAAKHMHHGYMGGLVEHTLAVAQICEFLAPRYKHVDRDLLITSALLHDIGKIYELSDFPDNDYTDDGQLIGHISQGYELLTVEIAKLEGFPRKLKSLLQHCILSHHGKYEFGSPRLPKTIEACILSYADITDAHIKMFEEALNKAPLNSDWVGYHKILARDIRKSTY